MQDFYHPSVTSLLSALSINNTKLHITKNSYCPLCVSSFWKLLAWRKFQFREWGAAAHNSGFCFFNFDGCTILSLYAYLWDRWFFCFGQSSIAQQIDFFSRCSWCGKEDLVMQRSDSGINACPRATLWRNFVENHVSPTLPLKNKTWASILALFQFYSGLWFL